MYSSVAYSVSKLLDSILKPAVSDLRFRIQSSAKFVEKINHFYFQPTHFLASIDVVALFDNVCCSSFVDFLPDILARTEDRWRPSVPFFSNVPISKLVQLFDVVLHGSFLRFDDKILLQTFGVPMGNPLSVSVSDLFLGYFETSFLDNCPEQFKPLFYERFVDDILLIFDSSKFPLGTTKSAIVEGFIAYLHDYLKDTKLRFTYEIEVRNCISFLDMLIRRSLGYCNLSVYRKATHSNRYISSFSGVPKQFVVSTLNTLRCRALRYCTSIDSLYSEFEFLRDIFKVKHGYNAALVDKYFTLENSVATCRPPPAVPLARVVLPFFGVTAYQLRTYLSSLGISVAFKSGSTLRSALYKPSTEFSESDPHNVIYLLSCDQENCSNYYIGQTTRSLSCRVKEHRSDISSVKPDSFVSAMSLHSRKSGHVFSFKRVLDRDSDYKNVVKKEALFILSNRFNPDLCNFKGIDSSAVVSDAWFPLFRHFKL